MWPVQDLYDVIPNITVRSICRAASMSGTDYQHALTTGLTDWQADRAAIRHGYHPAQIWRHWHTTLEAV